MQRIVPILAAAVICSTSTVAAAAVCTIVTAGGADVDFPPGQGGPPNNDRNYSLIAIEHCNGNVTGQWQDTLRVTNGSIALHADVTCLEVDGDDAWISGVITHINPPGEFDNLVGLPIRTRFRDNGTSANDPPDQAGFFLFTDSPNDCEQQLPDVLFDLNNGQVQIREF